MSNQKTVTLLTTLIVVIAMMTGCSPLKINPKDIQPIPQLKIPNKRNIALVLGAGGARGFAHIEHTRIACTPNFRRR